ncbi:MAG: hypothetical protein KDA24_03010 [Deltaproteobacteria bacterium]|nr:hypothetical protein [Deltaproteobacteria bacterium]
MHHLIHLFSTQFGGGNGLFGGGTFGTVLTCLIMIGWLIVYGLTIYQGFKDKSYGIPALAICLNFTYEVYFGWFYQAPPGFPEGSNLIVWGCRIWAIIDVVIVYQLFRWGARWQPNLVIKKIWVPLIAMSLVMAYAFVWTFTDVYPFQKGNQGSMIGIAYDMGMAILFFFLILERPRLGGINYLAGIVRVCTDVVGFIAIPVVADWQWGPKTSFNSFSMTMSAIITVFNFLFLIALVRHRRARMIKGPPER